MRILVATFAMFAVLTAAAACAQDELEPPRADDAHLIETCLNALGDASPAQRSTCIRAVSGPCINGPGGDPGRIGMVLCSQREDRVWLAIIANSAAALRARERATQTALLDQLLIESENWRRAKCDYAGSRYEGGSLAGLTAEGCSMRVHAELAIYLYGRNWEYDHR